MDWLFPEKGEDCVKQERIMLEGTEKSGSRYERGYVITDLVCGQMIM